MTNKNTSNSRIEGLVEAGYNWDAFADLLTDISIKEITSDLLYMYFQITEFHAQNSDVIGSKEQFGCALQTLRELYRTFEEMDKKGEGTLKLTL